MEENHSKSNAQNEHSGLTIGMSLGMSLGVALGITLDNLALWLGTGIALGLAAGMFVDENRKKRAAARPVKTLDGATFTLVARKNPAPDQRTHFWLGDNGQELELTDEEAAELL